MANGAHGKITHHVPRPVEVEHKLETGFAITLRPLEEEIHASDQHHNQETVILTFVQVFVS